MITTAVLLATLAGTAGATEPAAKTTPIPSQTGTSAPPSAQPAVGSQIVARFAGGTITADELEGRAAGPLLSPRQQVFNVTTLVLEGMIFDRLADHAAKAAGISRDDYLKREIETNLPAPPEEEVKRILTEFRAQLPPNDVEARTQVVDFLAGQEREKRMNALKDRLFAAASVETNLEPPRAPLPLREFNPSRGTEQPQVTLVEFTDFECPFCKRVQPTIEELLKRYPGKIRHLFKHMPLNMHQHAALAAAASLCAAEQGKFWPYHDRLFDAQDKLARADLIAHAQALQLDSAKFTTCLDSPTPSERVNQDMADAEALGIDGAPRFLINGRMLDGAQPIEAFAKIVEDELRRATPTTPKTTKLSTPK
jgi:protein-disulfide isomerase